MATYVPILDTQLDPDAPLTSQLMYQLRDNLLAVAEGASGALRIQGMALASDNDGLAPVTVSASSAVVPTAGLSPVSGILATISDTYVLGYTFTIRCYTGSMRFLCTHSTVTGDSSLQFRKNGSAVSTFSISGSGASAARTVDVAVAIGDVFEWYHANPGSGQSNISAISVTASDGYVTRPVYTLSSRL
jgi:hypothetical protein